MKVLVILLALNCAHVRAMVDKYGESAATAWARAHGWSEEKIKAARACLGRTS